VPHVIVEYSANIQKHVDIPGLIRTVHQAALSSGLFATAAVRTRAERRDVFAIADEHPQNAFVGITVRMASGRTEAERQRLADLVFDAACGYLDREGPHARLALSFEIQEIVDVGARRRNALHALAMDAPAPAAATPERR
jgi:5-carboxymethyl-2-hydroxymuconate isomerase